jgi:hypothetical protein
MRASTSAIVFVFLAGSSAIAAEPMAPSDIQATFFTGQAFTASTPSGTQYKMFFTPDGKMTREPLGRSGYKGDGPWKLNANGFCTSWKREKAVCFTIVPSGENKWLVQKSGATIATTVAVWSK